MSTHLALRQTVVVVGSGAPVVGTVERIDPQHAHTVRVRLETGPCLVTDSRNLVVLSRPHSGPVEVS